MKKVVKGLGYFLLAAILAGSIYVTVNYEKFDSIGQKVEELIGERKPTREVPPIKTPKMSFQLDFKTYDPENGYSPVYCARDLVLCSFKELKQDLILPYMGELKPLSLYFQPEQGSRIAVPKKQFQYLEEMGVILVADSFMQTLKKGDYYLILSGKKDYKLYYTVTVRNRVSFTSSEIGTANQGDAYETMYFDKKSPEDITIYAYNTGKNPIIEVIGMVGMKAKDYSISADGSRVVLSQSYLMKQSGGTPVKVILRYANGDVSQKPVYILVQDKPLKRLVLHENKKGYTKGKDHDLKLAITQNDATRLLHATWENEDGEVLQKLDAYVTDMKSITIPEDVLSQYEPGNYRIGIAYQLGPYDYFTGTGIGITIR